MGIKTKAAPAIKLDTLSDVNDLGKPWKFDDEDGLHVTRSCVWSPPGCHPVGCGVKLYVDDDGKLVKVEGDENHPVTQGRLCMRCIALKDYVYNPSRIIHPMKRERKYRGQADKWVECSMDEALDMIVDNYWKVVKVGDCLGNAEFATIVGRRLWPEKFDKLGIHTTEDFLRYVWLGKEDFNELAPTVINQHDHEYYKYKNGKMRADGQLGFNTPSGRIELWCSAYGLFGDDPLPYYEEPIYSPESEDERMYPEYKSLYPFVLTSGARTYCFFHSENRQVPVLREINPNPLIEINPEDAQRLGIADGQWCKVFNMFGDCVLKAKITQAVKPGVLHAQHGWWFPEENPTAPYLFDTLRSQINNLVPNFHTGKIGFGAPFKSLICNIEPTLENYDTDMQMIQEKFGRLA